MKKLSAKQKHHHDQKIKRAKRLAERRNKTIRQSQNPRENGKAALPDIRLTAPGNFSFIDKDRETIAFFKKAFKIANTSRGGRKIYFDLSNVKSVTSDAVMYTIAFVYNSKRLKEMNIGCRGNLPIDAVSRLYFEKVGFYKYVTGLKEEHWEGDTRDNIQIKRGNNVKSDVAGLMCDLIAKDGIYTITKSLYNMIIELMTNAIQHAYMDSDSKMANYWYIYAESKGDIAHFVFLDTGSGIPHTIQKKITERIADNFSNMDSKYISSALKGQFRTATKMKNRGKGLPGIYQNVKNGSISNLIIISGKGICTVLDDGAIIEETLDNGFEGTLFTWDFKIELEAA